MSQVPAPRRIRDLPGPRGLPLVGNLLELDTTRLHLIAEEWSRRYGEFYRFRIGARQICVVTDPEVIAGILRDRPDGFQRTSRLGVVAREFGFDGLFTANGERWKRQRPMVMASFDPAHTKSFFPSLVRVTGRFARRWQRAAAAGAEIDLQADLMRYTVDVTAGLAFGADINTIESEGEVIQQHLDKVLPALFKRLLAPFPRLRLPWLRRERALQAHLQALHHEVSAFIAQARERLEREPQLRAQPGNLIDAMIVARDSPGSGLDDADVAGNVLTMLLAGEDTTANTLAWMIYLLSLHPEALRRAREEVRGALGDAAFAERYEQLASLEYVEACANEAMRLRPVAPMIFAEAVRETTVAGVAVPAGQLIMCLMRPAAVDERRFADAAAFKPERWLGGPAPAKAAASARRVAMPFGAGPRLCPGRYLAMLEIKMVIAMLLAGFDIMQVRTPDGGPARETFAFTMSPVGLRAKLRVRQ